MRHIDVFVNRIICGDCIPVMKQMPSNSVDLVVTDPPYLVNYKPREMEDRSQMMIMIRG